MDTPESPVEALREVVNAILDIRESARGGIVDREAMVELVEERKKLEPLARMCAVNGEKRAVALFDYYLKNGNDRLNEIVGDDEIVLSAPEYRVPGGACDRALIHKSGRITLVEIKGCTSTREIVAGIGQVLVYAAKVERTTEHFPIVPVLAVLTEHDEDIARACGLAGVEYFPLGDLPFFMTLSRIAAIAIGAKHA